ncbi:MAG: diacylglycerol/lipid kinase family protein [Lachnospiraceae bacterium]
MVHIFLINPYAGKRTFADGLRRKLKEIPDFDYFVFNTRHAGEEAELVRKMRNIFEDEKLRFYCCGGSGTMRNMLNGFDSFDNVEIAFFPCGLTNDFLKVFGRDEERFHSIHELIDGDVIAVDYIRSNCGVTLNTFSLGIDTEVAEMQKRLRFLSFFGDTVPYTVSVILAMIGMQLKKYIVETETGEYCWNYSEIFFGNGNVLGGNLHFIENPDPSDGRADIRLIYPRPGLLYFPALLALIKKNYQYLEKYSQTERSRYIKIRRKDGGELFVNQDGELVTGIRNLEAEIVPKGIRLVVPKGVCL